MKSSHWFPLLWKGYANVKQHMRTVWQAPWKKVPVSGHGRQYHEGTEEKQRALFPLAMHMEAGGQMNLFAQRHEEPSVSDPRRREAAEQVAQRHLLEEHAEKPVLQLKQQMHVVEPEKTEEKTVPGTLPGTAVASPHPESYFTNNRDSGKIELHLSQDAFQRLHPDHKAAIRSEFQWSPARQVWASRNSRYTYRAENVARTIGLREKMDKSRGRLRTRPGFWFSMRKAA
jgi:hypothetical protein